MKKYFLTIPSYPGPRQNLYLKYNSPRIKEFCNLHNFKHIEATPDKLSLPPIMVNMWNSSDDKRFARWWFCKQAIDSGILNEGDIISYIDCDVFIAKLDQPLQTNKSFSYAIDSGNSHNTGVFSLKINQFTRKLINVILDKERFDKLRHFNVYRENFDSHSPMCDHDQDAYYHAAGIKAHSWVPFSNLPNYGFHSNKNEFTYFELPELLENVEILPVEWNVTQLLEETGENGKRNTYDIVQTTKDKVRLRHFTGGDSSNGSNWLFQEWLDYVNN